MNLEARIENLEKEIELIKRRNKKVEADKAWETSLFRILLITFIIYLIVVIALRFIGVSNSLLNALIPSLGYFLSTQSFPFIKKWWVERKVK